MPLLKLKTLNEKNVAKWFGLPNCTFIHTARLAIWKESSVLASAEFLELSPLSCQNGVTRYSVTRVFDQGKLGCFSLR